jgi:S-DNA-T family DNA segregation ATPase FtsK/SpoIIIE
MLSKSFIEKLRLATCPQVVAIPKARDYILYRTNCSRRPSAPQFASTQFAIGSDSRSAKMERILNGMGIECKAVGSSVGPVISRIYVALPVNGSIKQVEGVARDLAMKLGVASVNVVSDIAHRFDNPYDALEKDITGCVAIELPNEDRKVVPFGNIFNSPVQGMTIPTVIGVDPVGNPVRIDLAKTPHMLVAGQTGSGKSVCINSIITSVFLSMDIDMVRFLLIDPKQVELKPYEALPNIINGRAITDPQEAVISIGWLVSLMEYRYAVLAKAGFRNIRDFNAAVSDREKFFTIPEGQRRKMPYIVAVVDEFADLMMTAPGELTTFVMRIAQKARAVGIHLVLATQRPSTKVITGDLKCNIPTRIAFKVATATDSVTILGYGGAEKLLGYGDMLLGSDGTARRLHGCLLSDAELESVLSLAAEAERFDYEDKANFGNVDFTEGFRPFRPSIPEWVHDAPALADTGPVDEILADTRSEEQIMADARAAGIIG